MRAPPNVVLLVMDTTRADRISATGYSRETTPNLAMFRREATAYTDAWSPAGWTGPAHASLFTGLRPENHGYLRGTREFLLPESVTLAERFRDGGYSTACFTNNMFLAPEHGLTQGFDHFFPLFAVEDRPRPWAVATHRIALDWAVEAHRAGRPFFLYINDMEAHFPYSPPEAERKLFTRKDTEQRILSWGRDLEVKSIFEHTAGIQVISPAGIEHLSDLYDAEIRSLDGALSTLFHRLRDENLLEDTVVIVTADHGENLGERGLMDHVSSLHRSICHVPLIIRYPEYFPRGGTVEDVVRLEDVPPTLLAICGLPPLENIDGVSLLEDLSGRTARAALGPVLKLMEKILERPASSFRSAPFLLHQRSAYDGRFHLIRYSDGREEFYDVKRDPEEKMNLAPDGGDALSALRRMIAAE